MDLILAVAKRHNLFVLEDAAQAHGAEYRGTRIGNLGHAAIFSFYPGKNLGAYGDAGAIVTNDDEFAARARMMADHGRTEKYTHSMIGFGYRLDSLQAAILRAKLPHLEAWNDARREHVRRYNELLGGLDLVTPYEPDYVRAVYHIYAVRLARRDEVAKQLKAKGVETGIHYPIPLHMQPAYAHLGHKEGDFPVAEELARTELSLPMYSELADAQMQMVVDALKQAMA
jgi:dTDP-4-amino-4,6-dideoxygalactose transaminase